MPESNPCTPVAHSKNAIGDLREAYQQKSDTGRRLQVESPLMIKSSWVKPETLKFGITRLCQP